MFPLNGFAVRFTHTQQRLENTQLNANGRVAKWEKNRNTEMERFNGDKNLRFENLWCTKQYYLQQIK